MASIFKQVTGTWRAQVRRAGYKTTSKTFPTKAEAENWIRRIETKQDTGVAFSTKEAKSKRVLASQPSISFDYIRYGGSKTFNRKLHIFL